MSEKDKTILCYNFSDQYDYKEASREAETIEYIKANTDLNDSAKVVKLYHRLVEKQTFKTIIGYEFLKSLRDKIEKDGIVSGDKLPLINIIGDSKQSFGKVYTGSLSHDQEEKYKSIAKDYQIKRRNSRIINVFLLLIIAIMIIIAFYSRQHVDNSYEEGVINKYAQWEDELNQWEEELKIREKEIK